jgi:hypothetical protein
LPQDFTDILHGGFSIAAKATLDSWRYISNEFGYTYNKAPLEIAVNVMSPNFSGLVRHIEDDDGQIRQFSYKPYFMPVRTVAVFVRMAGSGLPSKTPPP